ncbi:MAG TPA: S-layer homology domain-containing protein [Chloroflexia bacterium]|jgi:hypothetical protein
MKAIPALKRPITLLVGILGLLAALMLLLTTGPDVAAQSKKKEKEKPQNPPVHHDANQQISGFPLTITVEDDLQMDIRYRDPAQYQFYGGTAEGVFLWANQGVETKVFGPQPIPFGNNSNLYTPVSNTTSGGGTPDNPWLITTVVDVPNTPLRLTQKTFYTNGAEFVRLEFTVAQIGGTAALNATLFHAADLFAFGTGSSAGTGYRDPSTGSIGEVFTRNPGGAFYQQFVPSIPATHYMEGSFNAVWDAIGDTSGPGPGFNNTVVTEYQHDAGAGLQWDLAIPANGSVTVGDTALFSPHAALCGSFSDVDESHFSYAHVYYLACRGVIGGYNDTTFRPNYNVTRGQLAKIVANAADLNAPITGQTFEDVTPDNSFYLQVERMARRGFLGGYPCGEPNEPCGTGRRPYFRPNANATRGQISKVVASARGYNDVPNTITFEDVPPESPFYVWVERMATRNILAGYPCGGPGEPCSAADKPYFRPNANATRAQTAKVVANVFFPGCCGTLRP